jgi:hypothetical protein
LEVELSELRAGIDTLSQRCGFPIVTNRPQVLVTIGNKVERLEKKVAELQKPCVWTYQQNEDEWFTSCSNGFAVNKYLPSDAGIKFCPYCQKPITESENDQ